MDYEKLHRDTISNLQQMVNSGKITVADACGICADFVPKSENERIRKEVINIFHSLADGKIPIPINFADIFTWLEKQGEHTIDKVEPKFREGEWITNGDYTWKIIEVKSLDYILQSQDGNIVDDTISHVDEQFHSFTIEDAKDGDVLSWDDSKCITIFKNIYDEDSFNSYGFVGGCTDKFESRQSYHDIEGAHPATKEQRDILFQKMKEAGYEWDADKKELKKIEQKPWSEEDEKMFEHIIAKATLHFSSINYLDEEEINFLKSLKDRVQPQLKQEWSQDDEQYLLVCKNALRKYQVTDKWDSNIISQWLDNKLKSLRPQNTCKPSDGQIKACKEVYADILSAKSFDLGTINSELNRLEEKLKKLKG